MSSWLSSNLTGSLSSISNLTGQISSFTREILTEGADEVSDPSAELHVAQARINELEAILLTQKTEYERVQHNNEELHVRLEASELQINNISKEYRAQLHNQEQELIKHRESSSFLEEHGHSFGQRERLDSTGSTDESTETKRLQNEIVKLQAECQRWKSISHGAENQDKLHKEIDQYQHELTALQSSYSQKIATLNKKHKQELVKCQEEREQFAQKCEELEERLLNQEKSEIEGNSHGDEDENSGKAFLSSLNKQLVAAEKTITQLKSEVNAQNEKITDLNADLQEKNELVTAMQKELDDSHAKCEELSKSQIEAVAASESSLEVSKKLVEKLQCELEDVNQEFSVLQSDSESLRRQQEQFHVVATENSELKQQLNHSQAEERRLYRCVEEVKVELEQLSGSTMELMEELQISHGLQQEQKIELETLKNVKYVKGEAKQEMGKLRSALTALWERHLCLVQLYQQVRQELHTSNARLLAMFQSRHLSTNSTREDLKELQQRLAQRNQVKLEHVVKEKEAMMSRSAELRVTVEELEGAVMDLQSDNEQVAQESKDRVSEMGRHQGVGDEDDDEVPDIVGALHAEKAVLESTIVGLEQKVQDLQERVDALQSQKEWGGGMEAGEEQPSPSVSAESVASSSGNIQRDEELLLGTSSEPGITQDIEVSLEGEPKTLDQELQEQLEGYQSVHSQEAASFQEQTDQLSLELEKQLEDYQRQLQEFELAQRDWEGEKEALEGLVLSLRRQVKELQGLLGSVSEDKQEITRLQIENTNIIAEKQQILHAWKTVEDEFVSLNISSLMTGDENKLDEDRAELLRADLHEWASSYRQPMNEYNDSISVNESTQTDKDYHQYLAKLQEVQKDNSVLKEKTQRLIQEIEEKTSKLLDTQNAIETKSAEVLAIRNEKRDLMDMINERDERICELEESFNVHLQDLSSSKDNEISLLLAGQEDVAKLLEENRNECSLLKTRNDELLDVLGKNQQTCDNLDEQNRSLVTRLTDREKLIESVEQEKGNLETMLEDKDQANRSLSAENNKLLMEREVLQSLVEEYKGKVSELVREDSEIARLQKEIQRLNQQVIIREESCKQMESKQANLLCEKDNLEAELRKGSAKLDNCSCELREALSELERVRVENSKLGDCVQNHVSACKDLEKKIADISTEKEGIMSQLGLKDLQVDKLELDLREKGAEIDLLKLDVAKFSKALKEKEQLIHTQVLNASNPDSASYQQGQLLRLLEEKDQEIAALKQRDASLVELVNRTDENSHRAQETYENKLQNMKEERERLLLDLSLREEELLNAGDRLEAMGEKMQGKDQASQLLHNEHARLLALNESQANEMGKLREKVSFLQKLVEERGKSKSEEDQRRQNENANLLHQINTLQVEHETLSTLVHEKDKQIAVLAQLGSTSPPVPSPQGSDSQLKVLQGERDVLVKERDSVTREIVAKDEEISRLREEILILRKTLQERSDFAMKASVQNEKMSIEVANLQSQLNRLSAENMNLVQNNNRIEELEDEIISCKRVIQSKETELKQVLDDIQSEKNRILVELESAKSEKDYIVERNEIETYELKNKILLLANSVLDSENENQGNVDEIDKNFQTLLHSVKNQRNSALRERDNEIQSLREQLSNVRLLSQDSADRDSGQLGEVLRDKQDLHRLLLQAQNEKQDLLQEKESIVADLQDQIVCLSKAVSEKDRASQVELQRVIQEKERIVKELDEAQRTNGKVEAARSQWQDDMTRLQNELYQIRGTLAQERETVTKLLKDVEQHKMALEDKEKMVKGLTLEREQLVKTVEQLRNRVQQLQEELSTASSGQRMAETKMAQELDRLRNHLVQVEESYTREALEAEEREKDLRIKVARVEEQLLSSSHSMLDRDRQASVQIENLQEQLQAFAAQRDRAVMDLALSQEKADQYQTSLNNLQLVLEQFQREREAEMKGAQEEAQKEVVKAWNQVRELQQRENHFMVR
ncbi:PREDICTED: thyroid receptor-interacting protein 11-like isoform X1 [Acropora digitifera]|uniref:thyroid receptor-interacting protein 11-like isoform X1 n=1 Tax=Acropora digitifera TaxID=70779 RepID=UPI00077ACDDD|nr:PREDICTED: thyroid receptor-interacting protein 11-like isoform X1 [Acropora digitifera]